MSDKTLEELEDELYAARDVYDAAPDGSDAEDIAWADYCRANEEYKKKLMEIEDGKRFIK